MHVLIKKIKITKPVKKKTVRENKEVYIITGIDKLLRAVQEKKKLMFSEAAQIFGVSEKLIEDWGNILERNKLIKMRYPLIGEPVLEIISPDEKKKNKAGKRGG